MHPSDEWKEYLSENGFSDIPELLNTGVFHLLIHRHIFRVMVPKNGGIRMNSVVESNVDIYNDDAHWYTIEHYDTAPKP